MKKMKAAIFWSILVSETAHVFCCVLPAIVSVFSILGSLSLIPGSLLAFHHFMHQYEIPVLIGSVTLLALGWALHILSEKIDCHDTGCGHPPCAPQKNKTSLILKAATILFVFNTVIYFTLHYQSAS